MKEINIRPTTSVYSTFERLSYEPWYAIAEFVDNSTQSFFDNKSMLDNLVVDIRISDDSIIITDNAFGMNETDFVRAVTLDEKPSNTQGRNEFGMGLKTAACWFSKNWTISSTRKGELYKYKTTVNLNELKDGRTETVAVDIDEVDINEHGTKLILNQLNRKISASRTKGKIKKMLSSIYREDIRSGKVKIIYDGEELIFIEPQVLIEELSDGSTHEWKQNVDFDIVYNSAKLHVYGFVAIRETGSRSDAGLILIRRGRAVIGGIDNYRPDEILAEGGFAYQRIFGELHLDDFPVTQAKDNFDWHNNGLEEQFIATLKSETEDIVKKAENFRKRERIATSDIAGEIKKDFEESGSFGKNIKVEVKPVDEDSEINTTGGFGAENVDITEKPEQVDVELTGDRCINISFELWKSNYIIKLILKDTPEWPSDWLVYKEINVNNNEFEVTVNIRHNFFRPFINDGAFITKLGEFGLAVALAEIKAKNIAVNGQIDADQIRQNMNEILSEMGDKND